MFKLLNKYRRGVSPVIAVVLLIALTVAAGAVIWVIAQQYLNVDPQLTMKSTTSAKVTSGTGNATLVINADTDVSLVSISADKGTFDTMYLDGTIVTFTGVVTDQSMTSGDHTVKLGFTAATAGSWTITITFKDANGGDNVVNTFDVTFS